MHIDEYLWIFGKLWGHRSLKIYFATQFTTFMLCC